MCSATANAVQSRGFNCNPSVLSHGRTLCSKPQTFGVISHSLQGNYLSQSLQSKYPFASSPHRQHLAHKGTYNPAQMMVSHHIQLGIACACRLVWGAPACAR